MQEPFSNATSQQCLNNVEVSTRLDARIKFHQPKDASGPRKNANGVIDADDKRFLRIS